MTTRAISRRRRLLFIGLTACIVLVVTFVLGELLIRFVSPRESLYPHWTSSKAYGLTVDENAVIVHSCPGKWRFVYTTNTYACRGRSVPLSNSYDIPNIVALGDSYTFGEGVDDSCVYTEHLADRLKGMYNVENLGAPGWGLTQEIRRFYEFGILYSPKIVILQYCSNDPNDDLEYLVTVIKNGRFQFRDADQNEFLGIKKYLSHSIIQKSQIYNLIRQIQFTTRSEAIDKNAAVQFGAAQDAALLAPRYYNNLLDLFSRDLARRGISLLMISVNRQLDTYPSIRAKVDSLDAAGLLHYVEIARWVPNPVPSPQGHLWGNEAHMIIGDSLAAYIRNVLPRTAVPPRGPDPLTSPQTQTAAIQTSSNVH